ncbi:fimbria/pilus outer membrane usher protein, partial [Escherichia coli]
MIMVVKVIFLKQTLNKQELFLCKNMLRCKNTALSLFVLIFISDALAGGKDFRFDSKLINGIDVSGFNDGKQLPGKYFTTVYINNRKSGGGRVYNIEFAYFNDALYPLLTKNDLEFLGVNTDGLDVYFLSDKKNIDLKKSGVGFDFSFYAKTLLLNIPSSAIKYRNSEIAPSSQWDNGVTAFIMNYDAKAYYRDAKNHNDYKDSYSLFVNPGINYGAWRIRNYSSWSKSHLGEEKYQNYYSYAERDIVSIKSRLLLGEGNTGGNIFDSIPFTGLKISTADDMIPYYERTSVPAVRGYANNLATVEVRQNDYLIYSVDVPAGEFNLTDIPAVEGVDLDVKVIEQSGTVRVFRVPYSIPAISLKKGKHKYDISIGKTRGYTSEKKDIYFGNLSYIYGLNDFLTLYNGIQISADHAYT